jgi:hypothetical protein
MWIDYPDGSAACRLAINRDFKHESRLYVQPQSIWLSREHGLQVAALAYNKGASSGS